MITSDDWVTWVRLELSQTRFATRPTLAARLPPGVELQAWDDLEQMPRRPTTDEEHERWLRGE